MAKKHTPTPWVVRETIMHGTRYGGLWIDPEDAEHLVPLTGSGGSKSFTSRIVDIQDHDHNDANARFIVRAVNSHDKLVEALRQMIVNSEGDGKSYRDCHKKAVAALASLDQESGQ